MFPIIGGRKVEHLHANLEALDIALTEAHIRKIEGAVPFEPGAPHNLTVRLQRGACAACGIEADDRSGDTSRATERSIIQDSPTPGSLTCGLSARLSDPASPSKTGSCRTGRLWTGWTRIVDDSGAVPGYPGSFAVVISQSIQPFRTRPSANSLRINLASSTWPM